MKKIISLILVVLLCLPSVFVTVSAAGADTYTITAATGADKTSNDYKNINKYLAYYDGGDTLSIPASYITVAQWKANIANPAINANGVADDAYITSDCTLTLTMDDATTKTVAVEAVDYNYMLKKYDKKSTTTFSSNDLGLGWSKGSKATVTAGTKKVSDGEYALTLDASVPSDATEMQGYFNMLQNLSTVSTVTTPYIINMTFVPESTDSLYKISTGFINQTNNGRAMTDLPDSVVSTFKASDEINVSIAVFPDAKVYDVYVNGTVVLKNATTEATSNNQGYTDYKQLFLRFYNGTKIGNVYKNLTVTLTDYEIRYGFGPVDAEIYVTPTVDITNYTDGAKLGTEDIVALEAVTNTNEMKTAALYIDGVKVDEVAVNNKSAVLDTSSMGYGDHKMEVRMYPETGAYISESIAVSITDFVDLSDYTITFDEFDVGETPASLSKPAEYFGTTSFFNYSNESLTDSSVIVKDAYVEYYDDARGNVFHTKADAESNTDKSGRRIEVMQSNTSNNMGLNFDMCFESFSGISFNFLETRGTGVNTAAVMGPDGSLTMYGTTTSETTSIQLEEGVWYNFDVQFYCTMGGIVKLSVYDESGSLVGSMESLNGAPYTDRVRIYTPYNKDNLQSGEAYIDNVKTTIISTTGSITSVEAGENTVSAVLTGVNAVNDVAISGAMGDVEILGYTYSIDESTLSITTAQPLSVSDIYALSVYADGKNVPMTKGFEVTGAYIKVTDSYFINQKGKNYVVLNAVNTTGKEDKITVLISEWNGEKLVSMTAKTITVAAGENKYNVEITGDVNKVKIMPVKSLAKPVLISNEVITK